MVRFTSNIPRRISLPSTSITNRLVRRNRFYLVTPENHFQRLKKRFSSRTGELSVDNWRLSWLLWTSTSTCLKKKWEEDLKQVVIGGKLSKRMWEDFGSTDGSTPQVCPRVWREWMELIIRNNRSSSPDSVNHSGDIIEIRSTERRFTNKTLLSRDIPPRHHTPKKPSKVRWGLWEPSFSGWLRGGYWIVIRGRQLVDPGWGVNSKKRIL